MNTPEGMVRTTVYLSPSMRRRLKRYARERGVREAHVIRSGIEAVIGWASRPPEGGFLREPDPRPE